MAGLGPNRWGAAALVVAALLYGCGPAPVKPDYVSSTLTAPLEMPPGIDRPPTRPETAIPVLPAPHHGTLPRAQLEKPPTVALEMDEIRVDHDGAIYWLVVQESQDQVWDQLLSFWRHKQVKLTVKDAGAGVMETDWLAATAAAAGPGELRDKFRARLEHYPDVGNTEIYVTDRVTRRVTGPGGAVQETAQPSDLEAADRILHAMAVFIGGPDMASLQPTHTQPQPQYVTPVRKDGELQALEIGKTEDMAWRHVGAAVDRLGYTIVTDDPVQRRLLISTGTARAVPKKRGFWARLFSPGATPTEMHVPVYRLVFTPKGGKAAGEKTAPPKPGSEKARSHHHHRERGGTETGERGHGGASESAAREVRLTVEAQADSGATPGDAGKILEAIYQQLQ